MTINDPNPTQIQVAFVECLRRRLSSSSSFFRFGVSSDSTANLVEVTGHRPTEGEEGTGQPTRQTSANQEDEEDAGFYSTPESPVPAGQQNSG